jgi:hypothetical protein
MACAHTVRRGKRRTALASRAIVLLTALAAALPAQGGPPRLQTEARIEVLAAHTTAFHFGLGVNAITGTNLRLALLLAGGIREASDDWRPSGRVEAVMRFHFDPLQQFPRGFYAGGGGAIFVDRGARARARTLVTVGLEGSPNRRRVILGGELGLGGGVRLGLTARRARAGAR